MKSICHCGRYLRPGSTSGESNRLQNATVHLACSITTKSCWIRPSGFALVITNANAVTHSGKASKTQPWAAGDGSREGQCYRGPCSWWSCCLTTPAIQVQSWPPGLSPRCLLKGPDPKRRQTKINCKILCALFCLKHPHLVWPLLWVLTMCISARFLIVGNIA